MLLSVGRLWKNGERKAAMQLPTRPIKSNPGESGLRERMQENVINHVG
jgi:hypothetical protein